jgi:hypothetical protein
MMPFRDADGAVFAELPFPPGWKQVSNPRPGEPSIAGPDGIEVTNFAATSFLFTMDPQLRQIYAQGGQTLRAMPGIDALVEQDLIPWAEQKGYRFVRSYEIAEVSEVDQWYSDQLFKAVPSQTRNTAIGTDWESAAGEPYFLLTHLMVNDSAQLQAWSYWSTGLAADPEVFARAKQQLVFALSHARFELEPIAAYHRREAEKAGASWAAHNQRMAESWASFEANQRAFRNKSQAAHDALMEDWRARNAASDKAHERFVDTITERTKVVNPNTGQLYKVESGSSAYWMNGDGEYIGTELPNYDPNLDETMNEKRWEELQEVRE